MLEPRFEYLHNCDDEWLCLCDLLEVVDGLFIEQTGVILMYDIDHFHDNVQSWPKRNNNNTCAKDVHSAQLLQ